MGDILKIVRCGAIRIQRGCDRGDFHTVPAVLAGEEETRQMGWGNVLVVHGTLHSILLVSALTHVRLRTKRFLLKRRGI
jgi:hypothetical protein